MAEPIVPESHREERAGERVLPPGEADQADPEGRQRDGGDRGATSGAAEEEE